MNESTSPSENGLTPAQKALQGLSRYVASQVIGQERLVERMLVALLADGHILVEGAPGLAKTRAINVLSQGIEGDFHRIQFTPDLLPADLTGTEIYRPQEGSFQFQRGPLFHNLVLADEINRSPAKVQSALLEAMAERQVTVGRVTYPLPELFLVMATQNPIEQEGTYPLPEAQLDRFMLFIKIGYPEAQHERTILNLVRDEARGIRSAAKAEFQKISQATLFEARQEALNLYLAESLEEYLLQVILATRNPGAYDPSLARWVQFGASPRATIALDRCARARAWLQGRDFVLPEDIQIIAPDVLRHRLILSYEAEADGVDADHVITELLRRVGVP
ncbi:MAG TPA: AAA family ATPase [Methylococcaceae bacterium]|jgi:MoxR-like ATPase|nr:AAA family ATPase [Methylococcaceae bacterium]